MAKKHRHREGVTGKTVAKHTPIPGLMEAIKDLEKIRGVHSIVPGPIQSPRGGKGPGELTISVQYIAPEGYIRLLAKKGNLRQEIRVVTSRPAETRERIDAALQGKRWR